MGRIARTASNDRVSRNGRRHGARVTRRYDRAQTPFQRLLAAGTLSPFRQRELATLYETLNPLRLQREIDAALTALWRLAARELVPPSPGAFVGRAFVGRAR